MKKNVGPADRYIRVLIGVSLLINIFIVKPGAIGTIILLALGLAVLYSAYSGYCWIYDLLKISTCKKSNDAE
ncbi:MAG TPA: DUF2892 domain-containing protein [Spirochaetota bacterium]|nr:DUF2892 domain-containing protein [Spirochaetota bacterium]HOM87511.1 DUF2892 domain-containing protein [Spirochaetota bacterium]HOR94407.1 DUF2892 domain-containing protein [Spirochaetota bacterium]HQG42272.1 DUF2892 domain-containing protein [Spirochaetota bacterium]HQI37872.1 DUF2892 domain-containing protein [Spirochaetota bacterium]